MIQIYSLKVERELSEGERQQILNILRPERKAKALRFRRSEDKNRGLAVGLLEEWALRRAAGGSAAWKLVRGTYGKPALENRPEIQYNISHSGDWILCGVGDTPLGIDVEQESKYRERVVARCFPPEEAAELLEQPEELRSRAFAEYWTMKESFMKYSGLGFTLPLRGFWTNRCTGELQLSPELPPKLRRELAELGITEESLPVCRLLSLEAGYACALCCKAGESYMQQTVGISECLHALTE